MTSTPAAEPTFTTGSAPRYALADDPPAGLIFHSAGEIDGRWTITDVWESREAYGSFREERLFPAIRAATGIEPTSGRQPTVSEFPLHNYVKP